MKMNHVLRAFAFSGAMVMLCAPEAKAGSTGATTIDEIELEGNFMGVRVVGTIQGTRPANINNGYARYWKFDVTTSVGKAWQAALLAAHLSGKLVAFNGLATPTLTGSTNKKAETLAAFFILD